MNECIEIPDIDDSAYIETRKSYLKDIAYEENHFSDLHKKTNVCGKRVDVCVQKCFKKCKVYQQNKQDFVRVPNKKEGNHVPSKMSFAN